MRKVTKSLLSLLFVPFVLGGCFSTQTRIVPSEKEQPDDGEDTNLQEPHIVLAFYNSQSSDRELLYKTTINDTKFTYSSSLYLGEEPTLEEKGFRNVFLGWYSYVRNEILEENQLVDMDDYEYNVNSLNFYRKDGAPNKFDIDYKSIYNEYRISFYASWEKHTSDFVVTFQSPTGEIYDVVNVPSVSYNYNQKRDSNLPAKYLGKTPKIYDESGPKKFVGWDTSTNLVTKDITATAIFDDDDSLSRTTKSGYSLGYLFKFGRYIAMIHNSGRISGEFGLYRNEQLLRTVYIEKGQSTFFDLTDGIDAVTCPDTSGFTCDYYKKYYSVEYDTNGEFERETYKIDLTSKTSESTVFVTGYARFKNDKDQYVYKDYSKVNIRLNYNQHLIVLDGITDITLAYVDPIDTSDYWIGEGNIIKKCQFPSSVEYFSAGFGKRYDEYGSEEYIDSSEGKIASMFLHNGEGIVYAGNDSNPYLIAYRGKAPRIAKDCSKIINVGVKHYFEGINPSELSLEVTIPKSVTYIDRFSGNGYDVRFEDSTTLKHIGTIYSCNLGEKFEVSSEVEFLYERGFLEKCVVDSLVLPSNLSFEYNPTTNCDVKSYDVKEINGNVNLSSDNGILMQGKGLLAVPSYQLVDEYTVKDGVETIYYCAIDEGTTYEWRSEEKQNLKIVLLPASVKKVYSQNTNADFYTFGDTPEAPFDIYGCDSDGKLIKHQGVVYGLYNDEAYVLSYTQSEVSENLEIPDYISARGSKYSVTVIGNYALTEIKIKSLKFGNNLRKIGYGAFQHMSGISQDIYIPDSVTFIGIHAFYEFKPAEEIAISISEQTLLRAEPAAFERGVSYQIEDIAFKISYVVRCTSMKSINDMFSYHDFSLPVKDEKYKSSVYTNDVSNLFYEIDGVKTCFNKILELELTNLQFNEEMINYYLPNIRKIVCKEKILEERTYYDYEGNVSTYEHRREIGDLIYYLLNEHETRKEHLKDDYSINTYEFYVNETEESFVDTVKEETYRVYAGESHGEILYEERKVFEYSDGIFYIDESIVGDGVHYILQEGDYDIPLVGGTYTMKIRYTEE